MRSRRLLIAVLICTGVAVVQTSVASSNAGTGGVPAPTSDPMLPLTAQQVQAVATKRDDEELFRQGLLAAKGPSRGVIVPASIASPMLRGIPDVLPCPGCGGGGSYPASAYFSGDQVSQINGYFCGPASVKEALGHFGLVISQDNAATLLKTTSNGTAWSGGGTAPTDFPVPDAMNAMQGVNDYVPQVVSSASSSTISSYEMDLEGDVYAVGAPLLGNAYEVVGGPHLIGHPNANIQHWFDIRGYSSSGASTMYEDSVHGASSISWSAGVPAYSTMSSSTIVQILEGRGYVW